MKLQDHVPKGVCRHCKQEGHYMRDCVEFSQVAEFTC
jgi:hypothetical protein